MKYIKTYESINVTGGCHIDDSEEDEPKIGDYVICKDSESDTTFNDFIDNNIGKIVNIIRDDMPFDVEYENIPPIIKKHFGFNGNGNINNRPMRRREILFHSPNKEEVEQYLTNTKYNL